MTATFCEGYGEWADHAVERGEDQVRLRCERCGHVATWAMRILPLFIVTGVSGVGKTSVVPELRRLLPDWEVFETDILWDSGSDWFFVKQNWLRVAHSIAQSGRATLLCGTMLPEEIDRCDYREFFREVHYLNLHCDGPILAARLRARPGGRGCTQEFIARHLKFSQWLLDHAATAFEPPLVTVDTTHASVEEVACQIRDWALARQTWDGLGALEGANEFREAQGP